jgi:hypothetical protein
MYVELQFQLPAPALSFPDPDVNITRRRGKSCLPDSLTDCTTAPGAVGGKMELPTI